jgi:hypothetical protein
LLKRRKYDKANKVLFAPVGDFITHRNYFGL